MSASFAGGCLGFLFTKMMRDYVILIGIIIIGSEMFVFGLDQYFPGLPNVLPKGAEEVTLVEQLSFTSQDLMSLCLSVNSSNANM